MRLAVLSPVILLMVLVSCGGGGAVSNYRLTPVVSGLDHALLAVAAHDGSGRLFLVEQTGRIKVLSSGASSPTTFLDLSGAVLFDSAATGLLGLVFHPQFAANGRFFVFYQRLGDGASILSEFHASAANPNVADTTETQILSIPQPEATHKGGDMHFGADGFLYVGIGDGVETPAPNPQDPQSLLGKILRIDVDNPSNGLPYSSPPDNPYAGTALGRSEIYALGFRNPWRFAFDPVDGRLFVPDVGNHQREEINLVTKGANCGWTVWEGTQCTGLGPGPCTQAGYTFPIVEYTHFNGRCAVIGGSVYRGAAGTLPAGSYVYGDYCSAEVWLLDNGISKPLLGAGSNIKSFGLDESGEILVVTANNSVRRISIH